MTLHESMWPAVGPGGLSWVHEAGHESLRPRESLLPLSTLPVPVAIDWPRLDMIQRKPIEDWPGLLVRWGYTQRPMAGHEPMWLAMSSGDCMSHRYHSQAWP